MKFYTIAGMWPLFIKQGNEYKLFSINEPPSIPYTNGREITNIFNLKDAIKYVESEPHGHVTDWLKMQENGLKKIEFYNEILECK